MPNECKLSKNDKTFNILYLKRKFGNNHFTNGVVVKIEYAV